MYTKNLVALGVGAYTRFSKTGVVEQFVMDVLTFVTDFHMNTASIGNFGQFSHPSGATWKNRAWVVSTCPAFLEGFCSRSGTSQKLHIAARYVKEYRDIREWVILPGQKRCCMIHGTSH